MTRTLGALLCATLVAGCNMFPQQTMAERQPGESEYWYEPRGRTDTQHNKNCQTVFERSKLFYQGKNGDVYAPTIYVGGVDEFYVEYDPSPTPISADFVKRLFRAQSNIPGLMNCGLTQAEQDEFAEPAAKALTEYGAALIVLKTKSVKHLDRTATKDRIEMLITDDKDWAEQKEAMSFASNNWADTVEKLKGDGKLLGVGVWVGAMWGFHLRAQDTTGPTQYCWWDLKGTHVENLP